MFNDIFDDLWAKYYAPKLSKWEVKQFASACRRPHSDLLEKIIKPQAYVPDKSSYLSLSQSPENAGRAHYEARDLSASVDPLDWVVPQFFTNSLRIAHPGQVDFHTPSQRVIVSPYYVFTFEYDSSDLAFFKQQLSWFRSDKNPLDAPIGRFLKELRTQFKDCVGLSVVYSGNKSFHYHFVFNTALVAERAGDTTSARHGFVAAWQRLAGIMKASPSLAIPKGMEPDPTIRFPEWYRRVPNAVRVIAPPKGRSGWRHFFDVPAGEMVPQVLMWEHLALTRSGRSDSPASIFEPASFKLTDVRTSSRRSAHKAVDFASDTPVRAFCAEKMAAIYPGDTVWPRFEGFIHHRNELRALFANSQTDKNPSSYMGENFSTVFIQGDNPLGLTADRNSFLPPMPRLPKPLGEMIALWTAEYEAIQGPPPEPLVLPRVRSAREQEFADKATDHPSATEAISKLLDGLVLAEIDKREAHFLSAPEGISKTRSLIASTPRYVSSLTSGGHPPLVMYAFDSYAMAEEKCAEFNDRHGNDLNGQPRLKGVVLPSFTKLYGQACAELHLSQISTADAAKYGYASLMAAIEALQPKVIERFRQFYARLRHEIGQSQPVVFCVHQVAHGWIKSSPARLMFSRRYWKRPANETDQARAIRMSECRSDTKVGLLVHDEVSAEKLVLAVPAELVAWIQAMKTANPAAWAPKARLPDQYAAFEAFVATTAPPRKLKFERALELAEVTDWETVTTAYSGEYGEQEPRTNATTGKAHKSIYGAVAGRDWCISACLWPAKTAHKTIVLTTEAVPAAIVRKLGADWAVTELDAPLIPRDVVETYVSNEVVSGKLGKLVKARQDAFQKETGRELMAISNKAKHVYNVTTHASAKGSNAFIGKDVVQTMAMMSPEQFEFYEALNAWTGRVDLVLTRHIDEFNQTAGRNLGFRRKGNPKHILLLNSALSKCLEGEPKARARYIMQECVSRRQLSAARAPKASPIIGSKERMTAMREALSERRRSRPAQVEPPELGDLGQSSSGKFASNSSGPSANGS